MGLHCQHIPEYSPRGSCLALGTPPAEVGMYSFSCWGEKDITMARAPGMIMAIAMARLDHGFVKRTPHIHTSPETTTQGPVDYCPVSLNWLMANRLRNPVIRNG